MEDPRIEALGLVEVDSIAAGIEVADAMLKVAPVEVVDAFMVTPGKYVILVHGDPSSVQSSVERGLATAGGGLVDSLRISFLHPQVLPALRGAATLPGGVALGLVETSSVAAGVQSADDAAKAADVRLGHLHLGRGIGGKSILLLGGTLPDVQAAVAAGARRAETAGRLVATRIIPQPHDDLQARVQHGLHRLPVPGEKATRHPAAAPAAARTTGESGTEA